MAPVERALVVDPDAELNEVFPELAQTEPRRALVCRGGRLAGLLSVTDATRTLEGLGWPLCEASRPHGSGELQPGERQRRARPSPRGVAAAVANRE
jgi:hypothetical protein